jgi:hypothetical protein
MEKSGFGRNDEGHRILPISECPSERPLLGNIVNPAEKQSCTPGVWFKLEISLDERMIRENPEKYRLLPLANAAVLFGAPGKGAKRDRKL